MVVLLIATTTPLNSYLIIVPTLIALRHRYPDLVRLSACLRGSGSVAVTAVVMIGFGPAIVRTEEATAIGAKSCSAELPHHLRTADVVLGVAAPTHLALSCDGALALQAATSSASSPGRGLRRRARAGRRAPGGTMRDPRPDSSVRHWLTWPCCSRACRGHEPRVVMWAGW
jgi:hypothetical protein